MKVFTTLPIPAVAYEKSTNSPPPPNPFKYFRGKILLTRQTDYSPTLVLLYTRGKPPVIIYRRLSGSQDQPGHEEVKINLCSFGTRERIRIVQPVIKRPAV